LYRDRADSKETQSRARRPHRRRRGLLLPRGQRGDALRVAIVDGAPKVEKKVKTIKLTREIRLIDRNTWAEAIDWLTNTAVAFSDGFGPRIVELDVKGLQKTGA